MSNSPTPDVFTALLQAIAHLQEIHDDSNTPLEIAEEIYPKIQDLTAQERKLRNKIFPDPRVDAEYQQAMEALDAVNNLTQAQAQNHAAKLKTITYVSNAVTAVLDLATAVGKLAS